MEKGGSPCRCWGRDMEKGESPAGAGEETWKRVSWVRYMEKGGSPCRCWGRDMEKGESPPGVGAETWKRVEVLQVLGQIHGKGWKSLQVLGQRHGKG